MCVWDTQKALIGERPPMKRFKETNGRPKRTRRSTVGNAGSPKSCEAHGDGAAIVAKRSGQRLRQDEGRQVSLSNKDREVRVMRTAETILELIRERGKKQPRRD